MPIVGHCHCASHVMQDIALTVKAKVKGVPAAIEGSMLLKLANRCAKIVNLDNTVKMVVLKYSAIFALKENTLMLRARNGNQTAKTVPS